LHFWAIMLLFSKFLYNFKRAEFKGQSSRSVFQKKKMQDKSCLSLFTLDVMNSPQLFFKEGQNSHIQFDFASQLLFCLSRVFISIFSHLFAVRSVLHMWVNRRLTNLRDKCYTYILRMFTAIKVTYLFNIL
jgi:hypothetical protein